MYFKDTTVLDLLVISFWISPSCFLTSETYDFGCAVGESHHASTAEVTTAGYLNITECFSDAGIFHLHSYLLDYFWLMSSACRVLQAKLFKVLNKLAFLFSRPLRNLCFHVGMAKAYFMSIILY